MILKDEDINVQEIKRTTSNDTVVLVTHGDQRISSNSETRITRNKLNAKCIIQEDQNSSEGDEEYAKSVC